MSGSGQTQGSPAVPVGIEVFMDIGPILDTGEGSTQTDIADAMSLDTYQAPITTPRVAQRTKR